MRKAPTVDLNVGAAYLVNVSNLNVVGTDIDHVYITATVTATGNYAMQVLPGLNAEIN
jgi:hypothetical protein